MQEYDSQTIKVSDLFVKALEQEGVEYIFAVPGEENIDLLESLRRSSIRLILTRHEQGAGFMAANYARLSGKVGVCLSTLGPGATNMITPAAYAQLGAMPLLIITGQKPVKKAKQGRFQILDTVSIMRPVTSFTKQITHAENTAAQIREAFRICVGPKPCAVHLELPEDIAREHVPLQLFEKSISSTLEPDVACIKSALQLLKKAKSPLMLIGADAVRSDYYKAIRSWADVSGLYFFTTQMGKGVIDERHPRYLGTAALSDNDFLHEAVQRADVIINIGHDVVEKPPFLMKKGQHRVIHVNEHSSQVDGVYFPQIEILGDIGASVSLLSTHWAGNPREDQNSYQAYSESIKSHLKKYFEDERFPMLPQRLVHLLRRELASEDIISLDNGVYKIWFARNYECHYPNTLLLDNALATMGAGLPGAMAAKLLYPERKVIAVCGDGGFLMNSQELETAVRLKQHLIVIILNDGAYGMIRWKQKDMGFEDYGLSFGNPVFTIYAQSYGAKGYRPDSDASFRETLHHCLYEHAVHVIDLPVDYSLNHPILNKKQSIQN